MKSASATVWPQVLWRVTKVMNPAVRKRRETVMALGRFTGGNVRNR